MRYDFRCTKHGVFELKQMLSEHTGRGLCPTCESDCKQVILDAPALDIEGMADAGCPGAFSLSGDRMERRHINAGQDHAFIRDDLDPGIAQAQQEEMSEHSAWEGNQNDKNREIVVTSKVE